MNVLIVHPCKGFYGGAEEVITQLYNYLEARSHHVRIITKNAPIGKFTRGRRLRNATSWRDFYFAVRKLSRDADVVLCFNFPATLATMRTKKPIVWYCNEPPELFTSGWRKPLEALNRYYVRKSQMRVVVATEYDKKRLENLYEVESEVVPYGVDYDFWSKGAPTLGVSQLRPIFLQVGTITPYKNQLASLRLLERVKGHLVLIGSQPDRDYLHEVLVYIEAHELLGRVSLLDHQPREEIRSWYRTADVLLHPVKEQGGLLTPFEAACAGLKVVVSRDFQAADFFGCWMEDFDSVRSYLEAPSAEGFQPSPEWVRDNLSWEKFGERIERVLKEASKPTANSRYSNNRCNSL